LYGIAGDVVSQLNDPEVKPGVQFGAESTEILSDGSLVSKIRSTCGRMGAAVLIHHPDGSTPGERGFVPALQLNLQRSGYLGAPWIVVHAPSGRSQIVSRVAITELINTSVAEEAVGSGVGIAVENPGPGAGQAILADIRELLWVIAEARDVYASRYGRLAGRSVGLCFDFGHLMAHNDHDLDLEKSLKALEDQPEMVAVCHIHMNDGQGDRHMLLGERTGTHRDAEIERLEEVLLNRVLPAIGNCEVFIMERNSPYELEDLKRSARMLHRSITGGGDGA
jgi:hypothetical protein